MALLIEYPLVQLLKLLTKFETGAITLFQIF